MSGFGEIAYAHGIMKAGFSPFWNPLLSCGTPLFAQPGLALGYPGTLLVLLLPGFKGAVAFTALHAVFAFYGFRRLALSYLSARQSLAVGAACAGASAAMGWSVQPSVLAGLAWAPWAIRAGGGAAAFPCWALLFSCGDAPVAVAAMASAGFLGGVRSLRPAALAMAASAMVLLPTLQALKNTRAMDAGFPEMSAEEGLALKAMTRESRVYFDPKNSSSISKLPVLGPAWVGGSRRPVKWVAESLPAVAQNSQLREEQLGLRGASLLFSLDGKTRSQTRLHAPFRAAFVSDAAYLQDPRLAQNFLDRPFVSRPLFLNDASAQAVSPSAGAIWTLLSMQSNALGEYSAMLPDSHGPGWFYASDAWYPGWSARIDGKRSPILRAEGAFRALHIESDAKIVAFLYRPWLIYLAWGFSLFMLIFSVMKRGVFAGMR